MDEEAAQMRFTRIPQCFFARLFLPERTQEGSRMIVDDDARCVRSTCHQKSHQFFA